MAYVYENDVTKVGGNLQKTVAYLLSLHKAEYEWNMLGIKVVGSKEALPIPDGTYEYGDAYMIGNKTDGFEMWIYTRADEFHTEAYWFDIGQFPKPGPQGPAGPGLNDIVSIDMSAPIENVTFDKTSGITVKANGIITGTTQEESDIVSEYEIPLVPGKYINMGADPSNSKVQVRVDDEKLALDYYKIDKSYAYGVIPVWNGSSQTAAALTSDAGNYSIAQRDGKGNTSFNTVGIEALSSKNQYNGNVVTIGEIRRVCAAADSEITINKTSTDTGTLDTYTLSILQGYPQIHIQYDNQTYYRMDPLDAPDGTLNFIHLDTVQTGGGYAARGKCFSITTSTRAWQVVDMSFGPHTHQLTITDNETNAKTYMTLVSYKTDTYAADELITAMGERSFPCTHDSVQNDNIYAGVISALDNTFTVRYSNNQEFNMSDAQVTITDYVV